MNVTVLTIDSATKLLSEAEGAVVVTGSHGAIYAADLLARGVVSRANPTAIACGVAHGMRCRGAVERLKHAPWP